MLNFTPEQPADADADTMTLLRAFANLSPEDPPPGILRMAWRMAITKTREIVAAKEARQ